MCHTSQGANTYKVELREDLGLSPIFYVADLLLYKGPIPNANKSLNEVIQEVEELNFPSVPIKQEEKIMDSRVYKKTRKKEYREHLVKWKGKTDADAVWIKETNFKKLGPKVD